MKLNVEEARQIVKGFKILDKYPASEEGETALAQALAEVATLEKARKFLRDWIRENRKAPMPCDIHGAFESVKQVIAFDNWKYLAPLKPGEQAPPARFRCNQCQDSGFYIVRLRVGTWEGIQYTAAKKCTHPPEERGELVD